MNRYDQKELDNIYNELAEIVNRIDELRDSEGEKFDNLPKNLQVSQMGEKLQENTDALCTISDNLSDIMEEITEIITSQ